eukprot:m.172125 g.172125  ORF g.172125 m.172125 type:complete len:719 (+) comp31669_c0_seq2:55-2211(+)
MYVMVFGNVARSRCGANVYATSRSVSQCALKSLCSSDTLQQVVESSYVCPPPSKRHHNLSPSTSATSQPPLLYGGAHSTRIMRKGIHRHIFNPSIAGSGGISMRPRPQEARAFSTTHPCASIDMTKYPPERIRNFSIIAHIDHGKSTLADRLLEMTGTIRESGANKQVMDRLQVERERGITVKAQTASIFYTHEGEEYLLNLIDTPGHVDFGYEVSCSLAACEGTLLVVDAAQGVQAQTLANFYLAFERDLDIIPVLNKVDLPTAQPEKVCRELQSVFDIEEHTVLHASAKSGIGIDGILKAVVERIKPPTVEGDKLKAMLFDTWFDSFRGVIAMVQMRSGVLKKGQKVTLASTGHSYDVIEVGVLHPHQIEVDQLMGGQVGYVITGLKDTSLARVGDTLFETSAPVEPLAGFKPAKCMVFAGLYPADQGDYEALASGIKRLCLNDSSVSVRREQSTLGSGFRLGFLGMLHMEVFGQRLEQEHNMETILTSPSVSYRSETHDGETIVIESPADFPDHHKIQMLEPMVSGTLVFPQQYLGQIIKVCQERRGVQTSMSYIDANRVVMVYRLPLNEIVEDFFDVIKGVSSGYATFDYEEDGYDYSDIVLVELSLNGDPVDALSFISHKSSAFKKGKIICAKLKKTIGRQLYDVAIQAKTKGAVIARETVKAVRKDVTAKCYGGDITRKRKLLDKQKEGKKKMRMIGTVEVPKEAFMNIVKR